VISIRTELEKGDPDLPVRNANDVIERMLSRAWFPAALTFVATSAGLHRQARAAKRDRGSYKANANENVFESQRAGYDGVFANSNVEREWIEAFDRSSLVADYQEQPQPAIPYREKDGTRRTYTPDVRIDLVDGRRLIIEVKPILTLPLADTLRRAVVAQRHAARNGWGYGLLTEQARGLLDLSRFPLPDQQRQTFDLLAAEIGAAPDGVGLDELKRLGVRQLIPRGSLVLAAYCVQYEIMVKERPWRLMKIPEGFGWATLFPGTIEVTT
jgi:hypothetical protein